MGLNLNKEQFQMVFSHSTMGKIIKTFTNVFLYARCIVLSVASTKNTSRRNKIIYLLALYTLLYAVPVTTVQMFYFTLLRVNVYSYNF